MKLVILALVVHLIVLTSVFKIYFNSPLAHGMTPHKSRGDRLSNRVVIFVADGLRAQSILNDNFQARAPFLYSKIHREAVWGVSHTQVPTESRPGHVALLAGFNEDPSAITKGWQENPVEYDSVINESCNTWGWGSPDIMKLFTHQNAAHVHLSYYKPEDEDFGSAKDATELDTWVFDNVEEFLKDQANLPCTKLCEHGNIFFLHLLGIDTAGHAFSPLSEEYINNIKVVDEGVSFMTRLFENFFNDSKTTYLFTADHGMTNWGSHGDGSEHETSVPFVAWGAGIKPHKQRQDVAQSDIAPLISSLLGINIPINSNGIVPLEYVKATMEQKAYIMYANTAQMLEHFLLKHQTMTKNCISLLFKSFSDLTEIMALESLKDIDQLIENSQFEQAIQSCYKLIKLSTNGIKYYHLYYQRILLTLVAVGYVGWIVLVLISITDLNTPTYFEVCERYKNTTFPFVKHAPIICAFICMAISVLLYVQNMDYEFYIYFLFPVMTWYQVFSNYKKAIIMYGMLRTYSLRRFLAVIILYAVGIELLVYTFYDPRTLTVIFILEAIQLCIYGNYNSELTFNTVIRVLVMGLTPLLIGIQTEFSQIYQIIAIVAWVIATRFTRNIMILPFDKFMYKFQLYLIIIAFINTIVVNYTIKYKGALLGFNKFISWTLLYISPLLPLFTTAIIVTRIHTTIIGFSTIYALMSTGCESIFLLFFGLHMINWIFYEHQINEITGGARFSSDDIERPLITNENTGRLCYHMLTYIMLGFFGVGNIASLSSFNPMWVQCFMTIFSPFSMTVLILIKLTIPFIIVLLCFRAIVQTCYMSIHNCFMIILIITNLMVLQFLYLIKAEGSWLEIGLSLSRFIVATVTTFALIIFYGFTHIYFKNALYITFQIRIPY